MFDHVIFRKNQKLILSIIIFLIVFCFLGFPFYNWGFIGDDFGAIFHSLAKNWKDVLKIFYEGDARFVYQPSNFVSPQQNFLSVLYRPLIFVFYYIQGLFWGVNPFGYYLFSVFLHSINSVILFNIFLKFTDYAWAFWGALFFAFHSSFFDWFGWISAQQQHLDLFFLLLIVLFLYKYLKSRKLIYFFLSLLFFVLVLLTRETFIVLPFLISLGIFISYENIFQSADNFRVSVLKSLRISSGFYFVLIGYFALRAILFCSTLVVQESGNLFKIYFATFFRNSYFLGYLLCGFSSIFRDFVSLRYFIIFSFLFLMLFLFLKNSQKKFIIFFLCCIFLSIWPSFVTRYDTRHLYVAIPFYVLIILFCVNFSKFKNIKFDKYLNKAILSCLFLLLFSNMFFVFSSLKKKEKKLVVIERALQELVLNEKIHNKPIVFLGLSCDLFWTGLAQAIWLKGINLSNPIYYDDTTYQWVDPGLQGDFMSVVQVNGGYRFISKDHEKLSFNPSSKAVLSMGEKTVNVIDNKTGKVFDFSIIVDKKYLDQNPVFISWDYKSQKFLILDPPLK